MVNKLDLQTRLLVFDLQDKKTLLDNSKKLVKSTLFALTDSSYNGESEEYLVNGKNQLDNAMDSFESRCFKNNELNVDALINFIKNELYFSRQYDDYYNNTDIRISNKVVDDKLLVFVSVADVISY